MAKNDSKVLNVKEQKEDPKIFQYDYIDPKIGQHVKQKDKGDYDFPVNIFKKVFFTWTRKVLKAANTYPQLELTHLGKFSPDLYPDKFLKEIKQQWEDMTKKTKSSPLIKALLKGNAKRLFLVFLVSLMVAIFDSLNVMLYCK